MKIEREKPAASFDSIFQVVSQAQASLPFFFMLASQLSPSQPLWEDRKEEDNLHLNLMAS